LLLVSAVPGGAATISFTSTTGGGDINTGPLGATATVTGLTEIFDTLTVTGAPSGNGTYAPLFLNELLNATTNVLTLTGTISGCTSCGSLPGLTTSSTLVSIQLSGPLTADATASGVSVNMPGVTSITFSSTLLADLGLSGASPTLTNLGNTANPCCVGGTNYQNQTSGTLVFDTTPIPEPTFLPLTALILGLGAFVLRRRSSGVV
jgi:hypothetical protein